LAKNASARPVDASALLAALGAIEDTRALEPAPGRFPRIAHGLVGAEQRLVSIIVAAAESLPEEEVTLESRQAVSQQALLDSLCSRLTNFGARADGLADGSLVATLVQEHGEARDQAARSARAAMMIKDRWPSATIAIVTGRGVLSNSLPVGDALDRAAALLRERRVQVAALAQDPEFILLDEVTARLLDAHFIVNREEGGQFLLRGENMIADPTRPLLGKPTPCVGREHELATLEACFRTCVEESTASAVLVLAPPGLGKSRLLHEFLRRLDAQHLNRLVLMSRGDPMSAGSSSGLLGQALRRYCGVLDGELPALRREKLTNRIGQHVPELHRKRVIEFIGELCSVPFPDDQSPKLRAARQNARVLGDQTGMALIEFLRAECQVQPVLLVMEDLHWGDVLSMRLVELALRELAEQPFMVLALGRPETVHLFPNLWAGLTQQIVLHPLIKKARERLIRQILGPRAMAATVNRIVEQSAGNALLLEELIRAVAEGSGDAPSETVLAMLQARVGSLEPEARRVLRAASIFGETFWLGGVRALLVGTRQSEDIEGLLRGLVQREILEERSESRFPSAIEYHFRHALVRDAAYSLLTDEDRRLGHHLAGEYLERMGESDAAVLAEHAFRGGQTEIAIPHFVRAAEQALDGNDLAAALERVEKGIAAGAQGEALGSLLSIRAGAHLWRSELADAYQAGTAAVALLPQGNRRWCKSMLTLFVVTTYLGNKEHFNQLVDVFREITPAAESIVAYTEAAAWLVLMASFLGRHELGLHFLNRMRRASSEVAHDDVAIRGWLDYAHAVFAHWVENDMWQKRVLAQAAIAAAEQAGDRRMLGFATVALGTAEMGLGMYAEGASTLRSAVTQVRHLADETILSGTAMGFLSLGLTDQEDPALFEQAHQTATTCIETVPAAAPAAGGSYISLARILAAQGALAEAEALARRALGSLHVEPVVSFIAYATLVQILIKRGDAAGACLVAEQGLRLLDSLDGTFATEVELLLAYAEARVASGNLAGAQPLVERAMAKLQLAAAKIPDAAARARYLTRVPTHAHLAALASDLAARVKKD